MVSPAKTSAAGTATPVAVEGRDFVCVGAVAGAHGIRGEVKVKPFTEDPMAVGAYGPLTTEKGRLLKLTPIRVQGGAVIARIEGVDDRNAAEALRGSRLHVPRANLPATEDEDEFYHADLIGLAVVDAAGEAIGKIVAIQDFGAGDMLDVALATGGFAYLPFTREVVPTVDVKAGKVVAVPPEGWLEEPEAEGDAE